MAEATPIIPDCKYAILNDNTTTIPTIATAGNLYKKAGSDGLYWATLGGGEVELQGSGGGSFNRLTVNGLFTNTLLVQNGSGVTVLNVNTVTPKLSVVGQSEVDTSSATAFVVKNGGTAVATVDTATPKLTVTGQSEVSTTSATAFVVKTGATEIFKVDTTTPKITLNTNTEIKGSLTAISSNVITFDDSMLQLSVGQTATDAYDQGFYGTYASTGVKYRGILYNLATSRWIHFAAATTDPAPLGILTGTYNMADLAAKDIYLSSNSTANTVRITATTPSASRIYTIPDAGADASFVMSGGGGGVSFQSLTLTNTTNQLTLGTTNTVTITSPAPAASRTYTIPDTFANSSFVMTDIAQTINSTKTFTTALTCNKTSNQLYFGGVTQFVIINAALPAIARTYTIADPGADANFIMSAGAQTVAGVKTFSSALTCSLTSNQIVLGTTNTVTISSTAPAASRTYTIPDTLANSSFVMTDLAQTINGAKTFTSQLANTLTTNQIVLGTTNTVTINSVAPTASRIYTIPDAGSDATFVLSGGGGGPSFASLTLTNTTNQLTLGTTNTVTVNSVAPAASRTYTIPDAGGAASFVMTAGAQTVAGVKTFSSALTCSATTNQITLGTTNTVTITSPAPAASRTYTIPDTAADSSFVMTDSAQTINGVKTFTEKAKFMYTIGGQLELGNTGSSGTVSLRYLASSTNATYQFPSVGGTFTFASTDMTSQTFTGNNAFTNQVWFRLNTDQMLFGTAATKTTITVPTPAANRTYTIPDTAANSSFVMTDLAQTINGVKTFSSALTCSATTNQITLGTTNTTTITSPAPAASRTYTIPDAGASASFVMSESTQTINGAKTFSDISVPVYAFYMRTTANLTIANGWSGVNWTSVSNVTINPRSWTTTSGQVTPNKAGYYMVSAFANTNATDGARHIVVSKNGSGGTTNNEGPIPVTFPGGATQSIQFAPKIIQMNGTTDYFYIQVYASPTTGTTTVWPGDATNYGMSMTVIYVGTS